MLKFILGTKVKMTTVFTEDGQAFAATIVSATPSVVTQIKTVEKDGYSAVQIGQGETKDSRVAKAQLGHAKGKALKHFAENRPRSGKLAEGVEVGQVIELSAFEVGESVTVSAVSKGKGFGGVVKRHGFHGGPRSHGQKHSERSPGSIGGSGGRAGGRVRAGMRMAGRMGGDRVTIKGLKIVQVNPAENLILVGGALPGHRGTLIEIREA